MSYAEQIAIAKPSKGFFGKLLEWATQAGRQANEQHQEIEERPITGIAADVAVDTAAMRAYSEYRVPGAALSGSDARLYRIAESISSTLPR